MDKEKIQATIMSIERVHITLIKSNHHLLLFSFKMNDAPQNKVRHLKIIKLVL